MGVSSHPSVRHTLRLEVVSTPGGGPGMAEKEGDQKRYSPNTLVPLEVDYKGCVPSSVR